MSPPQMVQTAAALTRAVKPRKKFYVELRESDEFDIALFCFVSFGFVCLF
jgi:hypothetical protein